MKQLACALLAFLYLGCAIGQDAKPPAVDDPDKKTEPQITVKGAKDEAAAKAKLRADVLLARCEIKPVMTDEEILLCKTAYKQTR